jgi:hypothetical protein
MTKKDFKKILRGDVLRWTGLRPPTGELGLVRRVDQRVHVLWEDGLDGMYDETDAKHLEHGP